MCQMYRCELAGKKGKISENITRQLVISLSLVHNMNKLVQRLELTSTRLSVQAGIQWRKSCNALRGEEETRAPDDSQEGSTASHKKKNSLSCLVFKGTGDASV